MTIQRPNRIKKKYLDENSVDGTKVLFSNNESFKALSANRTETELFKLNANDQLTILKIPKIDFMPVEGIDAVNKNYVDYQYTSLLNEAKIYTDAEKARAMAAEAAEAATRASEDIRVLSESKAYTDAETARAIAAEAAEAATRASEDIRVLSESKSYTDAETARAMAAEAAEAALRASEDTRILSESKSYTDAEKARALLAEAAEAATRASEDTRILSESKAYTNSEISSLINAAPEAYNTLKEIADYIASDQSATSQILSQLYDQDSRLDVIEGTGEGSVKKAETDSKAYTDMEVSEEAAVRAIEDARVLSQSKAYTDLEISTQAALRASEDTSLLNQAKAYTDAEKARAMAAEAAEAALRASEDTRVLSEANAYTDTKVFEEAELRISEDTRVLSEANAYTDTKVFEEAELRISEDARFLSEANAYTDMKVFEEAELRISEDARVLSEANAYTDSEVSEEAALRASEDVRVLTEAEAYTDIETARAMAAEAAEAALRASEDVRILSESKAYTDMEISEESATRASEDTRILSESKAYTDAEKARAMAAEAVEAALRASEDVRVLSESKAYTDMEINTHVSSKLGQLDGIATLDSFGKLYTSQLPSLAITDVYVVEYIADRDAITYQMGDVVKVTKAIQSASGEWLARTYIATDNGTWLDIVTESDVDTVNGQTGTVVLTTDDIAEGYDNKYFTDSRAQSAVVVNTLAGNEMDHAPSVSSVNSLVDSFGERIAVDSFVVTSQIIADNYIELQNQAFSMSIVPSIDRLLLLEGDDYVVSVVSGKTRLTFQNSLLQGYEEALEVGDKIKIRYLKDIRSSNPPSPTPGITTFSLPPDILNSLLSVLPAGTQSIVLATNDGNPPITDIHGNNVNLIYEQSYIQFQNGARSYAVSANGNVNPVNGTQMNVINGNLFSSALPFFNYSVNFPNATLNFDTSSVFAISQVGNAAYYPSGTPYVIASVS